MILVWSSHRRIRLETPPPDGSQRQVLAVPNGSTDVQVLGWAAECLEPAALQELREVIEREAAVSGGAGGAPGPGPA